jgi:ferric-dicitrate binding protein FerR (iron transport regulator)
MEPENLIKKYLLLAEKWMNGTITPEEEREFAQWYNEDQNKEIVVPGSFVSGEEEHRQRILQQIHSLRATAELAVTPETFPDPRRMRVRTQLATASVLLVLASAAIIWIFYGHSPVRGSIAARLTSDSQTVRPLGNRATLTLGNGSVVDLNALKEGPVIGEGGVRIDKQQAQLVYKPLGAVEDKTSGGVVTGAASAISEMVYNTLRTPRGVMYSVVLTDGTRVWLNASSSLRYPTTFTGRVRQVSLSGEAYFEVAQNPSQPFQVTVNGMEVNVLGTHFNIMAYDDESTITTTLLEGAVKVDYMLKSATLAPGQQTLLMRGGRDMRVRNVDVEEAVAWKNGILQFRSEDIRSVMRKVARWYDVDVRYEGEISDHFSGAIYRNAEVSGLLRNMELTHTVHFRIEGRTITVSP